MTLSGLVLLEVWKWIPFAQTSQLFSVCFRQTLEWWSLACMNACEKPIWSLHARILPYSRSAGLRWQSSTRASSLNLPNEGQKFFIHHCCDHFSFFCALQLVHLKGTLLNAAGIPVPREIFLQPRHTGNWMRFWLCHWQPGVGMQVPLFQVNVIKRRFHFSSAHRQQSLRYNHFSRAEALRKTPPAGQNLYYQPKALPLITTFAFLQMEEKNNPVWYQSWWTQPSFEQAAWNTCSRPFTVYLSDLLGKKKDNKLDK